APHLLDRAIDRVADQLLMPLEASQLGVDLRDDPPFGVVAVGVDRTDRANSPGRRPGPRTHVVGRRNALSALDQRPHFTTTINDGFQPFECHLSFLLAPIYGAFPCFRPCSPQGMMSCGAGLGPTASNCAQ